MAPYDSDPPKPESDPPANGPKRRATGKGPLCPICGNPAAPERKPFCTKRCADVDLHRWLAGVYAVPTNEGPDDEAASDSRKDEK